MAFSLYAATIPPISRSSDRFPVSWSRRRPSARRRASITTTSFRRGWPRTCCPLPIRWSRPRCTRSVRSKGCGVGASRPIWVPLQRPLRHSRDGSRRRLVRSKKSSRPRSIPSSGVICTSSEVSTASTSRPRISCCHSHKPNFYFHATTTYDILRSKGVPIGKRDFTGRLRLKRW